MKKEESCVKEPRTNMIRKTKHFCVSFPLLCNKLSLTGLKQHTFVISQSLCFGSPGMVLLGPLQISLKVLGRAECSSGGSTGEESASKLIHFIGKICFFVIV